MANIALVDHEGLFHSFASDALQRFGHVVTAFGDSQSALSALASCPPDVALFNLTLPDIDGIEMLRRVRQVSSLPIIIVSSDDQRMDEVDEVVSFRLGADDYIRTPVSNNILSERVRAVLRRVGSAPIQPGAPVAGPASTTEDRLGTAGIELFDRDFKCRWRGAEVRLTKSECAIIRRLIQSDNTTVSREALLLEIVSDAGGVAGGARTIDAHMKRIRKKFLKADPSFCALQTRRGLGYLFQLDPGV